ncbi:hypothetical protein LINPERPRIM_LOCUS44047, partial [Linum perenne]
EAKEEEPTSRVYSFTSCCSQLFLSHGGPSVKQSNQSFNRSFFPLFANMESIQQDHEDEALAKETDLERLVCVSSPSICGVSGSPNTNPRIGDDYQVKIPTLMSESEHLQLLKYPLDSEGTSDASFCFLEGLPVSIMLIRDKVDRKGEKELKMLCGNAAGTKKSSKSGKNRKVNAVEKPVSKVKDEPVDDLSVQCEKEVDPRVKDEESLDAICERVKLENPGSIARSKCRTKTRSFFVPGLLGSSWSEDQVESFVLGLYIFGKSFVPIRRFVDNNKGMGDILSFYYGRFYGSDRYNRWSDSRKVKRKKFISGEKLFTGWRQQELISRLQHHIPDSYQNTFQEMSEAITEGKIALEDYVSNLKTAVGIQVLVEAIGIGKGKEEDLTNPAMESSKANLLFPATSKACSSLSTTDIVNLLNSGFRLSKARCNDIFWEAVWPRLLARGWHSEQPNNLTYLDSKTYLVFLVPGVKKYSRRDLIKGIQYFDSVNDVLSKVASEPMLMELEEKGEARKSELDNDDDDDDDSVFKSRLYLKPRVSSGGTRSVKFTVVDSSCSMHGVKLVRAKRMRYSPRDLVGTMVTKGVSGTLSIEDAKEEDEDEEKDSKDVKTVVNEVEAKKIVKIDKVVSSNSEAKFTIVDTSVARRDNSSKIFELRHLPAACRWIADRKIGMDVKVDDALLQVAQGSSNGSLELVKPSSNKVEKTEKNRGEESNENRSRKTAMQQFSRRPKSGQHSNNLVPLVKRRRLTACISTEMNQVMATNFPGKLVSQETKIRSGSDSSLKVRDMKREREPLLLKLPGILGSKGKKVRYDVEMSKTVGRNKSLEAGYRTKPSSAEGCSDERGNLLFKLPNRLGSKEKKVRDSSFEACSRAKPSSAEGCSDEPESVLVNYPSKLSSKGRKVRDRDDLDSLNAVRRNNSLEIGCSVEAISRAAHVRDTKQHEPLPDLSLKKPQQESEARKLETETCECVTYETRNLDPGGILDNNLVSTDPGVEQQQSDMSCRRQSRRNRPLTTRALEALEYEFLNVRKRPRSTPQEGASSRRARSSKKNKVISSSPTHSADDMDSNEQKGTTSSISEPASKTKIKNGLPPSSIGEHSEGNLAASSKKTDMIENGGTSSRIDEHLDSKPVSTMKTQRTENAVTSSSINEQLDRKPVSTIKTQKTENAATPSSIDEHLHSQPASTIRTQKIENAVTSSSIDEHLQSQLASTMKIDRIKNGGAASSIDEHFDSKPAYTIKIQKTENAVTPSSINEHLDSKPASTMKIDRIENGGAASRIDEHLDSKPVSTLEIQKIENAATPSSIDEHLDRKPVPTTKTQNTENAVTPSSIDEHLQSQPASTMKMDRIENGDAASSIDEHFQSQPASTIKTQKIEDAVTPSSIDKHLQSQHASIVKPDKTENGATSRIDEHLDSKPASTMKTQKTENAVTPSSIDEHLQTQQASTMKPDKTENGVTSRIDENSEGKPASTIDAQSCCCP